MSEPLRVCPVCGHHQSGSDVCAWCADQERRRAARDAGSTYDGPVQVPTTCRGCGRVFAGLALVLREHPGGRFGWCDECSPPPEPVRIVERAPGARDRQYKDSPEPLEPPERAGEPEDDVLEFPYPEELPS